MWKVLSFLFLPMAVANCGSYVAPAPAVLREAVKPDFTHTGPLASGWRTLAQDYVKASLKDPYSVVWQEIAAPERGACWSGSDWQTGWRVFIAYNARNSYGAYVGVRPVYVWLQNERATMSTSMPDRCGVEERMALRGPTDALSPYAAPPTRMPAQQSAPEAPFIGYPYGAGSGGGGR